MAISRSATFRAQLAVFVLSAVAAASSHAQARFKVSADGQEVLDTTTQLTWRRCAEGMQWDAKTCSGKLAKYSYAGAKQQAAGAAKTGAKAWRIPSRDELVGLVDKQAKKKPKIDGEAFPKTPSTPFWATRPGTDDNLNAWLVSFSNGKVTGNAGQAKFALRLVRTGS
jgi:hypothetical protein